MKKILFVEDDAVIAHIYSRRLAEEGYEVEVAEDGLEAMKRLPDFKPDLIVLDLLMPKFTGVDVLKFIRRRPDLSAVRILVFSNSFLSNLVEEVATSGVHKALVKSSVTPNQLVVTVDELLQSNQPATVWPPIEPAPEGRVDLLTPAKEPAGTPVRPPGGRTQTVQEQEQTARLRKEFLEHRPGIINSLQDLCDAFLEAAGTKNEKPRLEDLNRKVRFLAQMAGIAGSPRVAQLSSALEAMLFDLLDKTSFLNGSSRETVASTIAQLIGLLATEEEESDEILPPARVLVVDDDAVSNRALVMALGRARIQAMSVTDPFIALKRLEGQPFDLVLLDINMPGVDGLSLCRRLRAFPQHRETPVIFVTNYDDYKTRAQSSLSGGDDLITKPILPMEVCVKSVSWLVKKQFQTPPGRATENRL